jgi:hypothetical protein
MISISDDEKYNLLKRLPKIELSYETIPHTKVSPDYNICIGIPLGVKGYAWFTFQGNKDYCFIMEVNKDKNITKIYGFPITFNNSIFANGTLFYGTIVSYTEFVIEDIFHYQGIPTKHLMFSERLGFLEKFFQEYSVNKLQCFYLPTMWPIIKNDYYVADYNIPNDLCFHHIQYRCLNKTAPYFNIFPNKKGFITPSKININVLKQWKNINIKKPQYNQITVFKIMADISFDIYRLFVYGRSKEEIYYNVAYIPNYNTSVMMNSIFRNIKENANIDYIEESEDEEEFENIDPIKYVDLEKSVFMECRFNHKFKKWVPLRVVNENEKVVHISSL